jgi:crotonobetainyl-CoA:carnitine CoA-transferase CaiB-like acyl-CoA transferase
MSSSAAPGAMTGLRVIDLTRVLGGPYCTQILADHGADVIKVEPPAGDEVRDWGPPFHGDDAAYFVGINRNKRSIGLDLAAEGGRTVLMKMLESADVLIENFKPGTLDKWGIGNDVLRSRFPKLVHCRISGFGGDGPRGGNPGYDAIIQAMTGMIAATGSPQSGPMRIGVPLVDITTGLYAAIGILMALSERQKIRRRAVSRNHAVRDRPRHHASARRELFHAWQAAAAHRQRASQSGALRDFPDPNRRHLHRRRQ